MAQPVTPILTNEERKSVSELKGLFNQTGEHDSPLLPKDPQQLRSSAISVDWVTKGGRTAIHSADSRFSRSSQGAASKNLPAKPAVVDSSLPAAPAEGAGPSTLEVEERPLRSPTLTGVDGHSSSAEGSVVSRIRQLEAELRQERAKLRQQQQAPSPLDPSRLSFLHDHEGTTSNERVVGRLTMSGGGEEEVQGEEECGKDWERWRRKCVVMQDRALAAEAEAAQEKRLRGQVEVQLVAAKHRVRELEAHAKKLEKQEPSGASRERRDALAPGRENVSSVVTVKKWDDEEVVRLRREIDALRLAHASAIEHVARLVNAPRESKELPLGRQDTKKWNVWDIAKQSAV